MRIAINTLGTRGDVQPYIALALELTAGRHTVQIAAPIQFAQMVRAHGQKCAALPGELLELLDTSEGKEAIAGGEGFRAGLKLIKHVRPLIRNLLDAEWDAAQSFRPDVIVYHPKSIASPHIAEKLGCPCILASPLPGFTPTTAFPSPLLPFRSLGPFNRASHLIATNGASILFRNLIKDWRVAKLGLSPSSRSAVRPAGTLYAYSRHVLPPPLDWGDDVLVSGYWFLDESSKWPVPPSLAAFLAAGDPPVYVGFGSMPAVDAEQMTTMIAEALARCGKRGLFATGGGALRLTGVPSHVYQLDNAPHDALFPHVAATIHHGGAGTTAASLRAGKPMTICPFFGDQPFWARRMQALGVAPAALNRRNMTVEDLIAALKAMETPKMREHAAALSRAMKDDDGCALAALFIEQRCMYS